MGFEDWKNWGMQLKNLKPITFSFIVSLGIAFVFLMATFYILAYSGPSAMSDALSTTGSYFGAAATLGAAIIAAHLFNDWKEQHDKQIDNKFIMDVINAFEIFDSDAALASLMFNEYDIKFNHNGFISDESTDLIEYIDPIIKEILSLLMPLSKLKAYFEYYELINNKTKSDEFEKITLNIRDEIYKLNTLSNTFCSKYEYLKYQLVPLLSREIWFLEENYINLLRASLKVKN